ncbi:SAM-dependent methyltransferase [Nonomuraea sp. NPDC049400]|uniref:SAM-dependent methyltransferase n=1 Tax=Nonomuraea sp. NPDC049400 TaxID=3364352 RepID=UPI003797F718
MTVAPEPHGDAARKLDHLLRPSIPRFYDFVHGAGKDALFPDRDAAAQVTEVVPELPDVMRQNRSCLERAVDKLAKDGFRQWLDIGAGIPENPLLHHIAQQRQPGARWIAVDNDPQVFMHGWTVLDHKHLVEADLRDPGIILDAARKRLDWSEPIVLLGAVLHFVPDRDKPREIMAAFRDGLPEGSCAVVTHATGHNRAGEVLPDALAGAERYRELVSPDFTLRSPEEFAALLDE